MKNVFGSGLFSIGRSDKGKQIYFIFGPTMFVIPFHEYSISQNFFWISCYQIILYTYYHVHWLWALKVVLWRSRHLPCVFKEYLETRNNLEEKENLWIQDLHLGDPQVRPKTRGPLVLFYACPHYLQVWQRPNQRWLRKAGNIIFFTAEGQVTPKCQIQPNFEPVRDFPHSKSMGTLKGV